MICLTNDRWERVKEKMMCDDTPTLLRRLKAKDVAIAELVKALEDAVRSMERMDGLLLKDVTYHNVEKGDIIRARRMIAKHGECDCEGSGYTLNDDGHEVTCPYCDN